ncbi:MAG: 5'/3'-nucleotidase SurE [Elusimicrobiota bacterium]
MGKRILVTNDDGINGLGLKILADKLQRLGEVIVVAPDHERSTASHSLTLHKPLRFRTVAKNRYSLSGSPADCVRFGILHLLRHKLDLVISGINAGVNLGEDVVYSGTVAAAVEGSMLDIPAIAVSAQSHVNEKQFGCAADIALKVARKVLRYGLPKDVCLNVNVPMAPSKRLRGVKGIKPACLGHRVYGKKVTIRRDPRGNAYYWLLADQVSGIPSKGSDVEAFEDGYATVTPLKLDWTDKEYIQELDKWGF